MDTATYPMEWSKICAIPIEEQKYGGTAYNKKSSICQMRS